MQPVFVATMCLSNKLVAMWTLEFFSLETSECVGEKLFLAAFKVNLKGLKPRCLPLRNEWTGVTDLGALGYLKV
jgi:hypothetical protein